MREGKYTMSSSKTNDKLLINVKDKWHWFYGVRFEITFQFGKNIVTMNFNNGYCRDRYLYEIEYGMFDVEAVLKTLR